MPYTPKNWVTDELIIEADLDHIEQGVAAALPEDLLDAKGDLIVASANDTPARLPAGSAGQVLSVDAAEATGLKWIPAPSGGGAGGGADYEGAWGAGTAYAQGDVVLYQGTHYIAVNPSTGQTPPSAAVPTVNAAGNELAYAEFTGTVNTTATTEATAVTVATSPAVSVDGATPIVVEFFSPYVVLPPSAAGALFLYLYQDGVSLGLLGYFQSPAAASLDTPVNLQRKLTPAAGSHVYSIRASVNTGTGSVAAGIGGVAQWSPGFIRVSTSQPAQVAVRTFTAPGIGTTLPLAPVDGDEYILVDSLTAPTYQWHFRYMASVTGPYKWVYVGGAPAVKYVDTLETTTTVGSWVDMATVISVIAPRAGDYDVAVEATLNHTVAGTQTYVGSAIGAGAGNFITWVNVPGASYNTFARSNGRWTGMAAGSEVRQRYYNNGAGTMSAMKRTLTVAPVRVA